MNKNSFRFLLALIFVSFNHFLIAEILTGEAASRLVPNSEAVTRGKFSSVPDYVRFKAGAYIAYTDFNAWANQQFQLPAGNGFKLLSQEKDKLGFVHYRLRQTVNNIPVEGTMYILHTKNGFIQSMNGQLLNTIPAPSSPTVSETSSLNAALQFTGATKYKWQLAEAEAALKENTGDVNATYFPKAELVYVGEKGKLGASQFYLAYKFDVYAAEPVSRNYVFVDANSGKIILTKNRIEHVDAAATAQTQYSGSRPVTTDSYTGGYRLQEAARGNGIRTYNALQSTNPNNTDFVNATTTWNNVNTAKDQYATDAHFASEKTYDFFSTNFGRNSLDDNGLRLTAYVHYDADLDNAFWDGSAMYYGDGSSTSNTTPFTTLDIGGHEITHGLTQYTADLDFQDESGALNESFSDCMGVSVRQFVKQSANVDYLIGNDNGNAFRSLRTPKTYGCPDTYLGQYWYTGTADNGGVHTNSGVQNHWFYVVARGETGTNDNSQAYSVAGITIDKAAAVAYRNLTVYLTNSSDYADARTYSIIAAEDLYGVCSPEVITVTNAWYAVGVGAIFSADVAADFVPAVTTSCTVPVSIPFTNASSNATNYQWEFGDGISGAGVNPSHTYYQYGTYSVKLVASSPGCGADSITKFQVITITDESPTVSTQAICEGQSTTLNATAAGNIKWYSSPNGGTAIGTGTSFTTPTLNSSATYYAESQIGSPAFSVGPATHTFGTGSVLTSAHYTIFNNTVPQVLISVIANAGTAGNRTIELRNAANTVLATLTVNLVAGVQTVPLNFNLPAQNGLRLGIWTGTVSLYRNSSGANYPYNSADNTVSITGNDADPLRFYYFYNWQILPPSCTTGRTLVTVDVLSAGNTFTFSSTATTVNFTANATTATSYSWSFGDGNTSTDQNPSHTYAADGTYTVQLTESNGTCSVTLTQTVVVSSTGMDEVNELANMLLLPNPVKDILHLQMNNYSTNSCKLTITNMLGEIMRSQNLQLVTGKNSLALDISALATGVYFMNMQVGRSNVTKRFVKGE